VRILYDHQVFSLQNAGGASRYFYELMKFLTTVPDAQTDLLLGISGTVYPFRELDSSNLRVMSFPEWLPPGTLRYIVNEAWSNSIAPFRGGWDVYHSTLYMRMPAVRARKLVATHHECTHERFPELFPDAGKIIAARKRLFPKADAIICVSESTRQDLLRFYNLDAKKTRVIHHGLTALPRGAGAAAALRKQVRRDYVLYVGMRPAFKNFDGLLQAFHDSRLRDSFDLLVLGGKPLTAGERKRIAGLGIADCVISLPDVSDELLGEAYAGAKLFVYPSFNEGFGFPPLEAMALGCPTLASRIPAIVEVCNDAPFYFDPHDQISFNRELLRAINEDEPRRIAVERGRQIAARYHWSRCGEQTLALYRELQ
jgi:glycosyltransferase involved in cell wall biosynthesis